MSRLPIQDIIDKYNEINEKLAKSESPQDMISLSKELTKVEPQYQLASEIAKNEQAVAANDELLVELNGEDAEMIELTQLDNAEKKEKLVKLEDELLKYLNPSDPRDDNNIILEIRAGAGGDESALFAADLLKMYMAMANQLGFKANVVSMSANDLGGYKEVMCEIHGAMAYAWYKYEMGVHRVQRVPATEKQGRIHTSTASVAIMPLLDDQNTDFKLDPKEIEMIVSTSSGKGGQSVNTTYSAVKMKHIPTGIEAQSQDERSQVQNRIKCLSVLTSRVYDFYEQQRLEKEAQERRQQVGRNDRSEKIRTYNFPQDRLTDHRYNKNWNQLPVILSGSILQVVEDIKRLEAERVLTNLNSSN